MNKQKINLLITAVFVLVILFGSLASSSPNGTPIIITPGSFQTCGSYVVFQEGTVYKARNGATGEVTESTNATEVIQSATDNLYSGGGKVSIKPGTYVVDGIHIKNKQTTSYETFEEIVLEGESKWDTVIQLRDSAQGAVSDEPTFTDRAVILAEPYDASGIRVTIRNLYIHGNNINQVYNISGIIVRKSFAATVEDNFVSFCSKYGIAAFEMPSTAKEIYIRRNRVSRLGLAGDTNPTLDDPLDIVNIYCPRTDCEIVDNIAGGTYNEGTGIYSGTSNTVMRNWVWTNNVGITMYGSDQQVSDNFIEQCAEKGIHVKYARRSLVSNNRIRLGTSGYTPSHGIHLEDAKYVTVETNKIFTNNGFTMTNGILEGGSSDYNFITSNYLHTEESGRDITNPVVWGGSHTTVFKNEGNYDSHIGSHALVYYEDEKTRVLDAAGNVRYADANASKAINNAFNLLTSGRTWKERVTLLGNYTLTRAVEVPSYTIFELIGELKLEDYSDTWGTNSRPDLLHGNDPDNGNDYIEIVGGVYDGNWQNGNSWNSSTNPWNFNGLNCLYFARARNLKIIGVTAKNAGAVALHYDSSINVTIHNSKIINPFFHGSHAGHVGSPSEPNGNFEYRDCYIEGPKSRPSEAQDRETDGHAVCDGFDEGVNIVSNVIVNGSYASGLAVSGSGHSRLVIKDCFVKDVGYRGISAYGHNVIVTNNVVQNTSNLVYVPNSNVTSGYGIYVSEASLGTISGNIISMNNTCGIRLSSNTYNFTVIDNIIANEAISGNGLIAQGQDCLISNNIIRGFQRSIGIYSSGGNRSFITGNSLTGATYWLYITQSGTTNLTVTNNVLEGSLSLAGSGHIIRDNTGFVTENSGAATIASSTSTTFDHGLAGTPVLVLCSFNTTGWTSWKWASTSTQITITVETSGTYEVYWSANYEP